MSDKLPRRKQPLLFGICIALLGAWLCFPALTSVHVEGFSANLQSIAILLHRHGSAGLQLADQQHPVVTEYLYMTRSGLVDALQVLISLTGVSSDGIFRAVILLSFIGYFLACFRIARTWSGESYRLLILAYLLTPGLIEIGFYFADNLTSAMFAMIGLAFIRRDRPTSVWLWFCAGACLAIATLIRVDAVLTVPAFALGLLLFRKQVWPVIRNSLCFIVGGCFVLVLAQLTTPFQLSDSLQISHVFKNLHQGVEAPGLLFAIAWSFFGPITSLLLFLGVIASSRVRTWQWNLGLTLLPILFYLYVLPHALEARMFLLLGGPAVIIQAGAGLRVIGDWWRAGSTPKRSLAAVVCLIFVVIFFGPVRKIIFHDGPRMVLGNFWSPIIWREWQRSTEDGMKQIDELVRSVQPQETVLVVTGHYNADHYVRLKLLQAGFDISPVDVGANCSSELETFRDDDRTVIHVRSEHPYGIAEAQYSAAYLLAWELASELKCAETVHFSRAELASWQEVPEIFLPVIEGLPLNSPDWHVSLPATTWMSMHRQYPYGEMHLQPLTIKQVHGLRETAQNSAADFARQSGMMQIKDYAQLRNIYHWRFGVFQTK